jgi:toxin ParE1/3/4
MAEYQISDRADADLFDIYVFGVRAFGRSQAVAYQLSFRECFEALAEHPRMGRLAEAIGRGIRRHEHGSHVVLYREEDGGVLIVAIVHGRSVRGLRA